MQYPEEFVLWVVERAFSGFLEKSRRNDLLFHIFDSEPDLTLDELYWFYLFVEHKKLM
jgi:hypothetical protein